MPFSIYNDALSRNVQRSLAQHTGERVRLSASMASGLRINSAADDAAGQAIASRMRSSVDGLGQARRNINDAASMLQVADGALSTIGDSLQRLRELAVAAGNGSYGERDRAMLQTEGDQILARITTVGNDAAFAGKPIFRSDGSDSPPADTRRKAVLDALQAGWLGSAENLVEQYYGLTGDGATLAINLDATDGKGGVLASVDASGAPGSDLQLNVDMADFDPSGAAGTSDGGAGPLYDDRIVAREMVHAVLLRSIGATVPQWLGEGAAQMIDGADESLAAALAGGATAAGIVGSIAGGGFSDAGAYVATRYLHDKLTDLGVSGGIKGLMTYMDQHRGASLGAALKAVTGNAIASEAAFRADFGAHGASYIATRMNLTNADTGAIGGADAERAGAPSRDAREVVPDVGNPVGTGILRHFKVQLPAHADGGAGTHTVQVQLGARAGDLLGMQFSAVDAASLGLGDLDLKDTAVALLHIDGALAAVNGQRSTLGAYGNRLDFAAAGVDSASVNLQSARSRIEDADYAQAAVRMTRAQILQEAASAMLSQANGDGRVVLALLR